MRQFLVLATFLIGWLIFPSCQTDTRQQSQQSSGFEQTNPHQDSQPSGRKHQRKNRKHSQNQGNFRQNQPQQPAVSSSGNIPAKVFEVLAYVRQNKGPMDGYVGGRRFGNFENHLPRQDASGQRIDYQEWDVNPKLKGRNRGTERLITGSDGRAWFTSDHYNTFTEVKN
jgi:ribonuclease T1